jgi:hypothetical protein
VPHVLLLLLLRTSLPSVHDLVEGLLHLLADGEDEVQHLAPVASHVLAQQLELTLVVMDAAGVQGEGGVAVPG